jgi:hypothetical protein
VHAGNGTGADKLDLLASSLERDRAINQPGPFRLSRDQCATLPSILDAIDARTGCLAARELAELRPFYAAGIVVNNSGAVSRSSTLHARLRYSWEAPRAHGVYTAERSSARACFIPNSI